MPGDSRSVILPPFFILRHHQEPFKAVASLMMMDQHLGKVPTTGELSAEQPLS